MTPFSVLLSLYIKEKPEFLEQALRSVFEQSCLPAEVVLVLDGPVTGELQAVVDKFMFQYPKVLKIIPLEQNVGLGLALNEGLKHCSYEYVARMDTDDICKPTRFEKQLAAFEQNPSAAVISSWIDEFVGSPENIVSIRKLPEKNSELVNYAQTRNPMNHPSVMFKQSAIWAVGGYKHFYLLEDYYLWARLITGKYELYNIQESLLQFRISSQMIARRGGWKYAKSEIKLFQTFRTMGLISFGVFLRIILIRVSFRLIPTHVRTVLYRKFLR